MSNASGCLRAAVPCHGSLGCCQPARRLAGWRGAGVWPPAPLVSPSPCRLPCPAAAKSARQGGRFGADFNAWEQRRGSQRRGCREPARPAPTLPPRGCPWHPARAQPGGPGDGRGHRGHPRASVTWRAWPPCAGRENEPARGLGAAGGWGPSPFAWGGRSAGQQHPRGAASSPRGGRAQAAIPAPGGPGRAAASWRVSFLLPQPAHPPAPRAAPLQAPLM